jgi:hypothetical protein
MNLNNFYWRTTVKFRSNSPDLEARGCYVFIAAGASMGTAAAVAMGATAGGMLATAGGIAGGALAAGATGAALGAGSSALMGGDVGKGALYGGIGGALSGGIGGAMGAGTSAAGAAGQTAVNSSPIVAGSNLPASAASEITSIGSKAAGALPSSGAIPGAALPTSTASALTQTVPGAGMSSFEKGLSHFTTGLKGMPDKVMNWAGENPLQAIGLAGQGINALTQNNNYDSTPVQVQQPTSAWGVASNYQPSRPTAYKPKLGYAEGGPVNKFYAAGLQQAQQAQAQQAPPPQAPPVQSMAPLQAQPLPQAPPQQQGIAGYARGRMVEGPGDGVSDGIEAVIDGNRPAALATSEYVIPARIVSELGNGSSSAGAKRLDQMVKNVQHKRKATMGKKGIAIDSKAYRALPV